MSHLRAIALWVGLLLVTILLLSWAAVLASADSAHHALAKLFPWPVVCTTRGCVSSKAWVNLHELQTKFSQKTSDQKATSEQALTTLVRQNLVSSATLRSSVTLADAAKYRQDILHLTDEAQIKELTNLSADEYDKKITLPFLQQEALRQQMKVESLNELYIQLSKDRWIFVLPTKLYWNYKKGEVNSK